MSSLFGRVALVTGGSRGIGRAIAMALMAEGAAVAVLGRDSLTLSDLERSSTELPGTLRTCVGDVSKRSDITNWVQDATNLLGPPDILINNAGINPHRGRGVANTTVRDWDRTMLVNLRGVFLATQAVLPAMRVRRCGWIITVSSIAGRLIPDGMNSAYRASKFGVRGFCWALAKDTKEDGIAVSLILPGTTKTDMTMSSVVDSSGWLAPEDIASAVVFLLQLPPRIVIPELTISPRCDIATPLCPYS